MQCINVPCHTIKVRGERVAVFYLFLQILLQLLTGDFVLAFLCGRHTESPL